MLQYICKGIRNISICAITSNVENVMRKAESDFMLLNLNIKQGNFSTSIEVLNYQKSYLFTVKTLYILLDIDLLYALHSSNTLHHLQVLHYLSLSYSKAYLR